MALEVKKDDLGLDISKDIDKLKYENAKSVAIVGTAPEKVDNLMSYVEVVIENLLQMYQSLPTGDTINFIITYKDVIGEFGYLLYKALKDEGLDVTMTSVYMEDAPLLTHEGVRERLDSSVKNYKLKQGLDDDEICIQEADYIFSLPLDINNSRQNVLNSYIEKYNKPTWVAIGGKVYMLD